MIKNVKRKLAKAAKATTTDVLIRFTDEEFMTVKKMTSNIPIAHVADDIYSLELSSVKYLLEILSGAGKAPKKNTNGKSTNGKSTAIEGGDTAATDLAIS